MYTNYTSISIHTYIYTVAFGSNVGMLGIREVIESDISTHVHVYNMFTCTYGEHTNIRIYMREVSGSNGSNRKCYICTYTHGEHTIKS